MKKYFQITSKSFDEMGVKSHKELWSKICGEYDGFQMEMPISFQKNITKSEDGKDVESWTMVFSTSDKDRHGDIVVQNWELDAYKANPVLLDSHNYESITRIIGKVLNIRVEGEQLKGEVEFAEMNPLGALAKEMVINGYINTSSVGFIPKEFDNEGRILKSELLENSLVSVPANARALFEKKVKELETETEEIKKEIAEEAPIAKILEKKNIIESNKKTLDIMLVAIKGIAEGEKRYSKQKTLDSLVMALKDMEKNKFSNSDENVRFIFKALRNFVG